jgi:uncharacterized membrane protein YdjX (TVP38/TMEM64 family)
VICGRKTAASESRAKNEAGDSAIILSHPIFRAKTSRTLAMTRRSETSKMRNLKKQGAFAFLLGYAAGMPLLVSASGLWFLADVIALFESAGRWAAPLFTVTTAGAVALALLPSLVMSALAGALFGISGIFLAVASYLLACAAAFEIVRRYLRPSVQAAVRQSAKARAVQETLQQADLRIIILSRLSPAIPFALMNILLGVAPLSRSTYLWGSFLGMLPRTAAAVAIGSGAQAALASLSEGEFPRTVDGIVDLALPLLAAVGTAGLMWIVGRAIWKVLAAASEIQRDR